MRGFEGRMRDKRVQGGRDRRGHVKIGKTGLSKAGGVG